MATRRVAVSVPIAWVDAGLTDEQRTDIEKDMLSTNRYWFERGEEPEARNPTFSMLPQEESDTILQNLGLDPALARMYVMDYEVD